MGIVMRWKHEMDNEPTTSPVASLLMAVQWRRLHGVDAAGVGPSAGGGVEGGGGGRMVSTGPSLAGEPAAPSDGVGRVGGGSVHVHLIPTTATGALGRARGAEEGLDLVDGGPRPFVPIHVHVGQVGGRVRAGGEHPHLGGPTPGQVVEEGALLARASLAGDAGGLE